MLIWSNRALSSDFPPQHVYDAVFKNYYDEQSRQFYAASFAPVLATIGNRGATIYTNVHSHDDRGNAVTKGMCIKASVLPSVLSSTALGKLGTNMRIDVRGTDIFCAVNGLYKKHYDRRCVLALARPPLHAHVPHRAFMRSMNSLQSPNGRGTTDRMREPAFLHSFFSPAGYRPINLSSDSINGSGCDDGSIALYGLQAHWDSSYQFSYPENLDEYTVTQLENAALRLSGLVRPIGVKVEYDCRTYPPVIILQPDGDLIKDPALKLSIDGIWNNYRYCECTSESKLCPGSLDRVHTNSLTNYKWYGCNFYKSKNCKHKTECSNNCFPCSPFLVLRGFTVEEQNASDSTKSPIMINGNVVLQNTEFALGGDRVFVDIPLIVRIPSCLGCIAEKQCAVDGSLGSKRDHNQCKLRKILYTYYLTLCLHFKASDEFSSLIEYLRYVASWIWSWIDQAGVEL